MARAIKSNGETNARFARIGTLLREDPQRYSAAQIDQVLTPDNLKQCKLEVLTDLFTVYHSVFGVKNWDIYEHVRIKGDQSAQYRQRRADAIAQEADPLAGILTPPAAGGEAESLLETAAPILEEQGDAKATAETAPAASEDLQALIEAVDNDSNVVEHENDTKGDGDTINPAWLDDEA